MKYRNIDIPANFRFVCDHTNDNCNGKFRIDLRNIKIEALYDQFEYDFNTIENTLVITVVGSQAIEINGKYYNEVINSKISIENHMSNLCDFDVIYWEVILLDSCGGIVKESGRVCG